MAAALAGLLLFIAVGWTANKFFAKEFEIKTLRQLTEKLARENYVAVRRKKGISSAKSPTSHSVCSQTLSEKGVMPHITLFP